MTYAAIRLAQLDALSRQRPLSDAEQREVMLRARQERRNVSRRRKYAECETERQKARNRVRQWRQNTPRYWEARA